MWSPASSYLMITRNKCVHFDAQKVYDLLKKNTKSVAFLFFCSDKKIWLKSQNCTREGILWCGSRATFVCVCACVCVRVWCAINVWKRENVLCRTCVVYITWRPCRIVFSFHTKLCVCVFFSSTFFLFLVCISICSYKRRAHVLCFVFSRPIRESFESTQNKKKEKRII